MGVRCGDLDDHLAGLAESEVLEVGARVKGQRRAGDRGAAFRRPAGDGVGEAGAVVVAVDVVAERGEVEIDGGPVLDRRGETGRKRRVVVGAGHGHRYVVHRRRTMLVRSGDLDDHLAGLAESEVLEVGARVKGQRRAGDRGGTLRRVSCDRVAQRSHIVVAVDVVAECREVHVHRRPVLGRGRHADGKRRRVVGAGHGDRHRCLVGVAVGVRHLVGEAHIAGVALGEVFEGTVGIEGKVAIGVAGRALVEVQ